MGTERRRGWREGGSELEQKRRGQEIGEEMYEEEDGKMVEGGIMKTGRRNKEKRKEEDKKRWKK